MDDEIRSDQPLDFAKGSKLTVESENPELASTGVVLITGAGSGIGRATAFRLAKQGKRIVCADIDFLAARRVAEVLPAGLALEVDVCDESACEVAVRTTLSHYGRLDAVVASAGVQVTQKVSAEKVGRDEFARILEVNLLGSFLTARAAAQVMISHGWNGRIVLIGSIASVSPPMAGIVPYAASKGGVLMLGRSLAIDWAPHNIRVNVVGPGIVDTPMTTEGLIDPVRRKALVDRIPLRRIAHPDDIADVIAFLISDASRYITGAFVPVDGGWLI